jgi:septum formation protein
MTLILASNSRIRAELLTNAGLNFTTASPGVDESAIKTTLSQEPTEAVAQHLAQAKACAVSTTHPNTFVIGADQILDCDTQRFDKPTDLAAARHQLNSLRGKTHRLVSAVTCVRNGATIWQFTDIAQLSMRMFTDAFLDSYFARHDKDLLTSVGAYKLESDGIQLFDKIDGDYFTVLGLPLMPLLSFLRRQQVIAS